ncbi:MAG: mfpsA 3 [Myxococcaceae bacterium]|nr:mfpsA 3 [Myxococcaceae bacterium]
MSAHRPLSVGLYTYSTQPRGSVVHCAALADALVEKGHSVTVYALAKPGSESFFRTLEAQLVLIACEPAPQNLEQLIEQRISEFARCVRELSPMHDVHHAQDCLAANALLRGRPKRGAVVRTVHHVEHFESSSLEHCQARSIYDSDLVLSVSEMTQNDVQRLYGIASERVDNGVERSRFERPARSAVAQLRMRLGLGDERTASPVLVSFGGIEPRKNTLRLLDAFLGLRRSQPQARWVIVGGASILDHSVYRDEFERRLARASEADQRAVICTGVLSEAEIAASYGLADVVATPSLREGFGLCALEALAAGVPLVASRRAPFTEYLDDRSALLVDPENGSELLEALERALSSEGRAERTRRGIECAQDFCWSRVAEQHQRLYGALLEAEPAVALRQPQLSAAARSRS